MTKLRLLLASLVVLLAFAAVPSVTKACGGYLGSLSGAHAFGYSGTLYGLGYVPVPPYFALHPPVYYGERYFRAYGGSPFARRSYDVPSRHVRARIVMNPHVMKVPAVLSPVEKAPAKVSDQVTARPKMIINPFYLPDEQVAGK